MSLSNRSSPHDGRKALSGQERTGNVSSLAEMSRCPYCGRLWPSGHLATCRMYRGGKA